MSELINQSDQAELYQTSPSPEKKNLKESQYSQFMQYLQGYGFNLNNILGNEHDSNKCKERLYRVFVTEYNTAAEAYKNNPNDNKLGKTWHKNYTLSGSDFRSRDSATQEQNARSIEYVQNTVKRFYEPVYQLASLKEVRDTHRYNAYVQARKWGWNESQIVQSFMKHDNVTSGETERVDDLKKEITSKTEKYNEIFYVQMKERFTKQIQRDGLVDKDTLASVMFRCAKELHISPSAIYDIESRHGKQISEEEFSVYS